MDFVRRLGTAQDRVRPCHFIPAQDLQPFIQAEIQAARACRRQGDFIMPDRIGSQPSIDAIEEALDRVRQDQLLLFDRVESIE